MPFLTGKPFLKAAALVVLIVQLAGTAFSASMLVSSNYMQVKGPAVISLQDLKDADNGLVHRSFSVGGKVILHLPSTVKNVLVEEYKYPTNIFQDEVRAYTVQQAIFWTIATVALGSAVRAR